MNKKGFTLTELLAVVVILGIIAGLSIPLIRNLSTSFEKKKYQSYADSVLASGKLFTDAYNEDMFGHNEYGCAYITYDKLVERRLLKDIEIDGVSCNSEKTYVRVIKQKDKYGYKTFISCGNKKNGKIEKATIQIPKDIPAMDTEACTGVNNSNLSVKVDNTQSKGDYDKNRKKTRVVITSGTGIDGNITMYSKWSQDPNDRVDSGFEKVYFKVKEEQEKSLAEGEIIKAQSKEILTPNGDGIYYLIVRVDHLQDLYGSSWKNPNDPTDKYVVSEPFNIDNTPPTINTVVYNCDNNGVKTGEALISKSITNGKTEVFDLSSTPGNKKGWLASNPFKNGVCIDFLLNDNLSLKTAKYEENTPNQKANATGYKNFDSNRVETDSYTSDVKTKVVSKRINEDGHRYLRLTVKDYAGNTTAINVDVKIDKTGPSKPTINNPYNDTWTNKNVVLTLSSSDALNEMGEYYFTYNTNANTYTTERSEAGTKWVKLNGGTGKKSFDTEPWTSNLDSTTYIQACDELENCSVKNNTIIKIDKTKPNTPTIVNINHNKWVKDSYGITVSSIDTAEGLSTNSGINEYYYSYNSNATEIGSNPDTQLVKLTGGKNKTSFDTEPWTTTMNKTTYVVVYDNAGNKSDSNSTIIKIDKTPPTKPTVDSYSEDSWYYTLTMTIRSSDAHSGIKSYQYTYNADAPDDVVVTASDQASQYWRIESGAETTKTSYDSDFVGERDQKVYWRTCDQVGNCSEKTAGNRVRVDRTGPTCGTVTKTTSSSNQSTSGAAGSITCTDAKSGCKTQSFSGLTTTPKSTITIKDNVGNKSTCEVPVTRGNCVTYKCKGTIYPYSVIANGSSNTNSAASDYTEQQCRNVCGYPNGTNGIHYKWIANYFEAEISENVGRVHISCSCTGSDHSSIGRCSWSGALASCKTGGSSDLISCSYLINNRGCCGCCNAGIECTKYKYY